MALDKDKLDLTAENAQRPGRWRLIRMRQEDIERGEAMNAGRCPVAQALRRTYNLPEEAHRDRVYAAGILEVREESVLRKGLEYLPIPRPIAFGVPSREVYRFYTKFDGGYQVEPINFYVWEFTDIDDEKHG